MYKYISIRTEHLLESLFASHSTTCRLEGWKWTAMLWLLLSTHCPLYVCVCTFCWFHGSQSQNLSDTKQPPGGKMNVENVRMGSTCALSGFWDRHIFMLIFFRPQGLKVDLSYCVITQSQVSLHNHYKK